MIPIKNAAQQAKMRESCRIAATILERLCRLVAPGVNTYDIDQAGRKMMEAYGVRSACYNYRVGSLVYPAYTCLSVNCAVVHGIGQMREVLKAGDVVSVDVCIEKDGYIGDNARTVAVGDIDPAVQRLLDVTATALEAGIAQAHPGHRVGYISNAIEQVIRPHGYGIIRDFVGHGVGKTMHEPPQIPNFGARRRGDTLRPGMTLAIEPMVALGTAKVKIAADGWTALTADGRPAAHFEHTVLVTATGPEILTIADPALIP